MIFITSDTHYGHVNICRGTTRWSEGYRDFDNPQQMNQVLIDNINAMVGPDDILYHLGDWAMGGFQSIAQFRERLNVNTIYLVLGNHDEHIRKNRDYIKNQFTGVYESHELRVGKQHIVMHHFPMYVWNKHHRGAWMLHGHCHGSLHYPPTLQTRKIMDVGVDTNQMRPWSLDQIADIMAGREIIHVDHHQREDQ